MELNPAKVIKDDKNGFYKDIRDKRKTRDNVGPLLKGKGDLATQDSEKDEVLNAFFAFIFASRTDQEGRGQAERLERGRYT